MRFSEVLASLQAADGHSTVRVDEGWLQGRTVFGGLQAAIALRAMRGQVPADLPLRSLQTTFIAPLPAGTLRVEAQVLRRGRSAIHAEARLYDGSQLACLVIGVFGSSRPSALRIEPPPVQPDLPLEQAKALRYVAGITPEFTRHVTMRWARGTFPFKAASEARTQIYVSLPEEPTAGEAEVVALADIIPSPGLSMLRSPTPASSLTWSLELLSERIEDPADGAWLMDAEVTAGGDGYLCQTATLWSPQRRAVALSRQIVAVFG
jgi:acyl-CoA thioesterase